MEIVEQQKPIYSPLSQQQQIIALKFLKGWKARKTYKGLRKDCRTRRKAIEELIKTEKDYRLDLEILDKNLRIPLLEEKIINDEQERKLFPNFQQFKSLSDELLSQLIPQFLKYNFHQTFGDILKKKAPFFAIYIQYMNSY